MAEYIRYADRSLRATTLLRLRISSSYLCYPTKKSRLFKLSLRLFKLSLRLSNNISETFYILTEHIVFQALTLPNTKGNHTYYLLLIRF